MAIEFDPAKSEWNVRERGLPFSMVEDFDWETSVTRQDARSDYGEPRYVAFGRIGALIYVVVFTPRGDNTRVISFRRANDREIKAYEDSRPVQDGR